MTNSVGKPILFLVIASLVLIGGFTVGHYIDEVDDIFSDISDGFGFTSEEEYVPQVVADVERSNITTIEETHPNIIYSHASIYIFNFTVPYDCALLDFSMILDNTTYFEESIYQVGGNRSEILEMQIRDELTDPYDFPNGVWNLQDDDSVVYNTSDLMTSDDCNQQWYTHELNNPVVLNASKEYFFYVNVETGTYEPAQFIEVGFVYDTDNGDSQFLWYYDKSDWVIRDLNVVDVPFKINITDTWVIV